MILCNLLFRWRSVLLSDNYAKVPATSKDAYSPSGRVESWRSYLTIRTRHLARTLRLSRHGKDVLTNRAFLFENEKVNLSSKVTKNSRH